MNTVHQVYITNWQQEHIALTLAEEDKVFDRNNIIYAANGKLNAYYIIYIDNEIVCFIGAFN